MISRMRSKSALLRMTIGALLFSNLIFIMEPVYAAPNLAAVRLKVRVLQENAASAGEAAQQAQVELNSLNRTLASVQKAAAAQAVTVSQFKTSLGNIAREQYKSGGIGQSMELLFSSNPTLYLAAAGSLEAVTRKQSLQLRQYAAAKQRLNATSLMVSDRTALAKAAQARFTAQKAAAQNKLAEAEKLLASLTKTERGRLAKLVNDQENADQAASNKLVAKANLGSGRGALALRFSIKQIGDRYVFGAAGPTLWDCSGLTMRAFGAAGVSLPHSAAAQAGYGRSIPLNKLQPGDLVFFGGGKNISHVGVYLGDGRMVSAPRPGARVKVQNFGYSFGSLSFRGARRI